MAARTSPEAWYWSYDIKPADLDTVLVRGARFVRLSSYRKGTSARLAALLYQEPGPARRYALDLDAAAAAKLASEPGSRPVAVTVDATDAGPRFALLLEPGDGPAAALHLDLDADGLRALGGDRHEIADLATYTAGGARRFAAITVERPAPAPGWVLAGVTAHELDAKLVELGAGLVRVRPYTDGGRAVFAAYAEPADPGPWGWYAALDADAVSRTLERNASYPLDLEATRDEQGLRFTVVMYRDRA